ncbi:MULTISPECIES: porin [unclassified Herbaspirillum]|uniref:porin n=1 Tax=unclassified Herbaspirillum TaxID=2624150 RepID=UPI001153CF7C|nr:MULTISPECIES: porin [unclassified Herbaspirillum]MBB5390674.1 putative porin [Herbaspirillum sp. SJZ102]TQK08840.1 putative porin [Herbaspirillum sp. SJZ130]TQK14473.1 putative porin [Herbaspirillum sp. SJZ106]TWC66510.1 putative porin [Herbaspirillum sp. SJZ099]
MKQVKPSFIGAKTLCALALLGAFSAQAQAQTSVTIYGRIVAGVDFQTNAGPNGQGTKWSAANNQWGTSMIGFKGTEDLGGGNNAFFLLESGFNSTKGGVNGTDTSSSALFNRRSYVGLGGSYGSVKLGKNLFINNDIWFLDPTGQQAIGTSVLVNQRNWPGASNVIEYASPDFGGFTVGLQTSLGEKPGSFSQGVDNSAAGGSSDGRKDGISLAYQKNGLELRAIYDVVRDANGKYTNVWAHSKELILGGTYKFDKLKMFVGYENLRAPDATAGDPDRANHYWIGANYDVTPQFQLVGAFFRVNANNGTAGAADSKSGGGGSANLYMAGINYFLSKRTMLYVDVGTVRNSGNASHALEWGSNTGVSGLSQTGGYFGIAHSF